MSESAFEDGLPVLVVPSALLRIDQHFVSLLHLQKLGLHFLQVVRVFILRRRDILYNEAMPDITFYFLFFFHLFFFHLLLLLLLR